MIIIIVIMMTQMIVIAAVADEQFKSGLSILRPVRLLRVWVSEGLTQANP